mmetsp:Transcript_155359/g.498445  ORF Transcript_155359/g.498445 Transcript_155359/m.498445 type:complete len:211 (-) Transcript_155359:5586-6218(-)
MDRFNVTSLAALTRCLCQLSAWRNCLRQSRLPWVLRRRGPWPVASVSEHMEIPQVPLSMQMVSHGWSVRMLVATSGQQIWSLATCIGLSICISACVTASTIAMPLLISWIMPIKVPSIAHTFVTLSYGCCLEQLCAVTTSMAAGRSVQWQRHCQIDPLWKVGFPSDNGITLRRQPMRFIGTPNVAMHVPLLADVYSLGSLAPPSSGHSAL